MGLLSPGRLPWGTGIGETGEGCEGGAERAVSPGQEALNSICGAVGFASPLHYFPKDKNRAQKQQRMYFLFCFYISWRDSRCQSKETALSGGLGDLGERRPAYGESQGAGDGD